MLLCMCTGSTSLFVFPPSLARSPLLGQALPLLPHLTQPPLVSDPPLRASLPDTFQRLSLGVAQEASRQQQTCRVEDNVADVDTNVAAAQCKVNGQWRVE